MVLRYVKERKQFNVPIAAFQVCPTPWQGQNQYRSILCSQRLPSSKSRGEGVCLLSASQVESKLSQSLMRESSKSSNMAKLKLQTFRS